MTTGLRSVFLRGLPLAILTAVAGSACGGGTDPLPTADDLVVVASTDGQVAPAGAPLPVALAVLARTADGDTVPRAAIRWQVVSGAGAVLSDTLTLTDGHGRGEVGLTLGPAAGEYRVQATPVDAPSAAVTLTATATAPPVLSAVTPSSFTGGDTLVLTGSALSAAAEVEVSGAPARLLTGSATSLTVIAPPCLAPGAVQVRARVAGAVSNALAATFTSSLGTLDLTVGEYAAINPAQLAGCATFPAATGADTVEYLVAPQSATGVPGASASYRLAGDSVVVVVQAAAPQGTPVSYATRFHDGLRRQEADAALLPRSPLAAELRAPVEAPTVEVGDRRSFQVCNTIPCTTADDFATVTAEAQYVGRHAAIFLDQMAPAGGFTAADMQAMGVLFDDDLYGVATDAFGSESDVDANGVTIILFTPEVNRLTPESECGTSIITGYFFGIDIDPAFQNDSRSNKGEVFYAIAPDPNGTVTCALSTDLVRRLVPVTFVHEFQHMISYHQHVLVRNRSSEVLWLNEGLSHIAEELAGLHFEAQGNDTLFSRFAIGDLYNGFVYLKNPGATFVLPGSGSGTLEERGAAWLFLRWLLDQHGNEITRRLVETYDVGADNVARATGTAFDRLITQWFLANWVSDLSGFTAPARLTYSTWRFRQTYASLHDQLPSRFDRPFPLVPLLLGPGTFRLDGTLRSGSGDYVRIQQAPGAKGFTLRLTDPAGGAIAASVVPRLNVIRTR
jgi:hypothetical protein